MLGIKHNVATNSLGDGLLYQPDVALANGVSESTCVVLKNK